mgnify:FL=1|jgi:hypothetical protein|tara:strand:- start:1783 stop:2052 length:270 start_codon:yes stop_codon:yes gene_type:complete
MLKKHKNPKGGLTQAGRDHFKKTEGANLKPPVKKGVNPRRISFAARFAGMKGPMKKPDGTPTRKALALRAWGFRNEESARNFANQHKKS